jgi:hypothetical protein
MTKPKRGIENEYVVDSFLANRYFHIFNADGGVLKITSQRLIFKPHAFNFNSHPSEISLDDVVSIKDFNPLGVIPNGIEIITYDGQSHKFVTWERGKVLRVIKEHLPKIKRHDSFV